MIQTRKIFLVSTVAALLVVLSTACSKDEGNTPDTPGIPAGDTLIPETAEIIMYEVNIRAFGPGAGFEAVIQHLDAIRDLSVNVLWLMPVYPIGSVNSVNSPYSVQDYYAVNPEFGSMSDFKDLVGEAHERGMAVILDWVANHTAWDNPWIENKDWYTQDGAGNIVHPPGTNWLDVADLNYDNQEMRLAMIDAMKFWIDECGIDGYRCDAADMVPFGFWKQALGELRAATGKPLILLAEGARKDHYTAGFQMTYGWDFYNRLKEVFNGSKPAGALFSTHNAEYAGLPGDAYRLRFTTNHDESAWDATPMVLFNGMEGALASSVIAVFLGGVPLLYSSQEVGVVENVPFFSQSSINWSQNPQMREAYDALLRYYSGSPVSKITEYNPYNHDEVLAFSKSNADTELLVLVNTSGSNTGFAIPENLAGTTWTDVITLEQVQLGNDLPLDPYEYHILER